ncbi:hypothetical protein CHL67_10505 [Prosthecochloris sp. GSB1]|uniref:DUF3124 domain-containing protein n=1 Tax=Prosthecochloris sp. GSB1 TaxID=281093 RepID=UPI000B8CDFF7|nr:DUF3124 domain-containing protein [Prosthecochloris sp. GSB1]ASQ91285.1 hypothetical protein CHL67_10505 [Prosthecochloris sp. GSB1]
MKVLFSLLMALSLAGACAREPAVSVRQGGEQEREGSGDGAAAELGRRAVLGRTVYVPVYSHIYYRDERRVIQLAVTLSVRNTDRDRGIVLNTVRYFDSDGKPVRKYLSKPVVLGPMASRDFVVHEKDTAGGSGASFIVEWSAADSVTEPVIEAVMISTASAQGISLVSPGRVLRRLPISE